MLDSSHHPPALGGLLSDPELALQVMETLGQGITITDASGRFEYVNPAYARMLGCTPAELIGRTPFDVTFPEDHNALRTAREQRRRSETSTYETRLRRADGSAVYAHITGVPRLCNGEPAGTIAVVADLTERQRMEDALRQSEARKSAILATALDSIIIVDHEGRIIEFSPTAERTFGCTRDEVLGKELAPLILPPWLRAAHQDGMAGFLRSRQEQVLYQRMEMPAVRADGTEFPAEVAILPIQGQGPRIFACYLRDITERKQTEAAMQAAKEEAERANRAKSEFLSRMSHELRTPLNAILGFGQLLELDDLPEESKESVHYILKGGQHLLALINEVLDIARIEAGGLSLTVETVHLGDVIADTLTLVRPQAAAAGIELRVHGDRNAPVYVTADTQRLKQVLLNLLANAIKYNRPGGSVAIAWGEDAQHRPRVSVTDTGSGIPSDQLPKLFAPFERLGAETSSIEGTGLGLALSKRLIEAMEGEIGMESTVGHGSVFWLELPRARPQLPVPPAPAPATAAASPAAPERSHTILYIEDNLANLKIVEHVLARRPGCTLIPALQGRLGLDLAREHQPDLVLLDLNLPDIMGDEVLRRLRSDPRLRHIPVIIISADATPRQIDELIAAGAYAYLTKPIELKRFLAALDECLPHRDA